MYKKYRKLNPKKDNKNWQILFNTQFQNMQSLGALSTVWMNEFSKLGFDNSKRPTVKEINTVSEKYTKYRFIQTKQNVIMNQIEWYRMIARYEMPITNFVRTPEELDYCDEPDSFHEIMGHVVFLLNKEYSEMYQNLAKLYIDVYKAKREDLLQELNFIGGYIIELGLIKEPTGLKAFGSTLYSSGEVKEAFKHENQIMLGNSVPKEENKYDRSSFQGKYYIIESTNQINLLLDGIREKLSRSNK
jgi:phenylalanine-4-hydroxylase